MNVGIIVYSKTGNTLSVAQKIHEKLKNKNILSELEKVIPVDENNKPNEKIKLKYAPDISKYDTLIFASPVHAFSLAPAMKTYLEQVQKDLSGKKINCFVTQGFRYKCMGGNHTIRQMRNICQRAGGTVSSVSVVNWNHQKREELIEQTVEEMSKL